MTVLLFSDERNLSSLRVRYIAIVSEEEILEPPTTTLLRMTELVLTLNTFEFNGEYYKQTGGVAMGSRLGPNYACLFVGYVEERMLSSYTGIKPDLYKRYMDDVAGAASCSEEDRTSVISSSLPPRSTRILNIHGRSQQTNFLSWISA